MDHPPVLKPSPEVAEVILTESVQRNLRNCACVGTPQQVTAAKQVANFGVTIPTKGKMASQGGCEPFFLRSLVNNPVGFRLLATDRNLGPKRSKSLINRPPKVNRPIPFGVRRDPRLTSHFQFKNITYHNRQQLLSLQVPVSRRDFIRRPYDTRWP